MAIFGNAGTNIGITVTVVAQQALAQFQQITKAVDTMSKTVEERATPAFNGFKSAIDLIAAGSLVALAKGFVDAAAEMERMTTSLSIIENSVEKANQDLDQLLDLAGKAPFSLGALADAFIKIKTGGFENAIEMTRTLVDAVAAFGGSEQKLHNAAFAIQEIGGKGVVQMKELRRQLGDAIPDAIASMAEGLDMSITELTAKVSKGMITAQEGVNAMMTVLNKNTKGAAELFGNTFNGAIQQVKTQWDQLARSFDKAGGLDVFTTALQIVKSKMQELNEYFASPEGQAGVHKFIEDLLGRLPDLDRVAGVFKNIISAVQGVMAGIFSIIPPEVAGMGLFGYILLGKKGVILTVIAAEFGDTLKAIGMQIAAWMDGMRSWGGDTIIEMGILGFLVLGRRAGLIAMAAEILDRISGKVVYYVAAASANMYAVAEKVIHPLTDYSELVKQGFDRIGGNDAFENMRQRGMVGGAISTSRGGQPDRSDQSAVGDAAAEAEPKVKSYTSTLKEWYDQVFAKHQEFDSKFGRADRKYDLTEAQQKAFDKLMEMQAQASMKLSEMQPGGNTVNHWIDEQNHKLTEKGGIMDNLATLKKQYEEATNPELKDKIGEEIKKWNDYIKEFKGTLSSIQGTENKTILGKFEENLGVLNAELDAKSAASNIGTIEKAAAEAAKPFAEMQKRLDEWKKGLEGIRDDAVSYKKGMDEAADAQDRLNKKLTEAVDAAKQLAQHKLDLQYIEMSGSQSTFQDRLTAMSGAGAGDKVGAAVAKAQQGYDRLLGEVNVKADEARQKALENPQEAQRWNDLAKNLEDFKGKMASSQDEILEHARYTSSEVGKVWSQIGSGIESSLAKAFTGIADGTFNAKQILLGFYNDITKALMDYLAKQAMIQMFGGGGDTGYSMFKMFGGNAMAQSESAGSSSPGMLMQAGTAIMSMFGGGAANGGVFPSGVRMFANGGIIGGPTLFGLAGEAGPEAIMPLERVGGKLGVRTAGGGGDSYHVQIQALDGPSVRDLFYREGDSLVGVLNSRARLNRAGRMM